MSALTRASVGTTDAAVRAAAGSPAGSSAELAVLGPLAKRHCVDVFWHVAAEMIQLHGGIGFTWEHEAHRYLKRAKTSQLLHGNPAELRRRNLFADNAYPATSAAGLKFEGLSHHASLDKKPPDHTGSIGGNEDVGPALADKAPPDTLTADDLALEWHVPPSP